MIALNTTRTEWFLPENHEGNRIGSFSMFNCWLECGQCFQWKYIDKLPAPVKVYFPIGGYAHKAAEVARRSMRDQGGYSLATAMEAGTREFVRSASDYQVNPPEDCPGEDALGQLMNADIAGDISVDLGKKYGSLNQALLDASRFIKDGLPPILEIEKPRGYQLIEAYVEYGDCFPFPFTGRIDCQMKDGALVELKTASRADEPDFRVGWQMRAQALPLWRAEDPFTLEVATIVKTKETQIRRWGLKHDDSHMRDAYDLIVRCAEGISEGRFVPKPNRNCLYHHSLPAWYSIPAEVAA